MRRCTRCVLPETFPGIKFNDAGMCNYCQNYKGQQHLDESKSKYRQKFENLLKQYKNANKYDCLIGYSGGKDSSYTLYILKKVFNLNILAFTFDNSFLSSYSFDNIKNVTDNLCVDHILFRPRFDILKRIFIQASKNDLYSKKTLERASTICTSCIGLVKFISLRIALEKNIPFIAFGWSPGQAPITSSIFKNNPTMLKQMQQAIKIPLYNIIGADLNNYFVDDQYFDKSVDFPYNISPLSFLDYNEDNIFSTIGKLGWKKPSDTDANSSNCLLNSYANEIHKKKFNFHPYAFEIAKLVREGYLKREEALTKLETKENPDTIKYVLSKLHD